MSTENGMSPLDFAGESASVSVSAAAMSMLLMPLMLVLFIATLDQTIVATPLGGLGKVLGDASDATWIAAAYLLTSAVSSLISGKLGDMLGRKPVFLASVAIVVVGSALAPSILSLIALGAIQGIVAMAR